MFVPSSGSTIKPSSSCCSIRLEIVGPNVDLEDGEIRDAMRNYDAEAVLRYIELYNKNALWSKDD